ncbi:MAG: FAD-binding protein [Oligoflexia bacterium]|nr:FAD-binding protein [Oligoflexia bacterium]
MKNYSTNNKDNKNNKKTFVDYEFDVLIIGSGIAGLAAAIKLSEYDLNIGIVTREKDPRECNTYWAQGELKRYFLLSAINIFFIGNGISVSNESILF